MAHRVTKTQLLAKMQHLNEMTGQNPDAYTPDETGRYRASVGTYVLDWCYGGVRLCQIVNEGGAIRTLQYARGTKRETLQCANMFLLGFMAGKASGGEE